MVDGYDVEKEIARTMAYDPGAPEPGSEEEYMTRMAEAANIQLAREGLLPPEQLSTRERRIAEEAVAAGAGEREERVAEMRERERAERAPPAAKPEPTYEEALEEEIGAEEPRAAPVERRGVSLEETLSQALGLTRRRPSRVVETPAKEVLERQKEETLEAVGREQLAELRGAAIEAAGLQRVADIEQETHNRLRDMQIDEARNEFERRQYIEQEKLKRDQAIDKYRTGQIRDPWADRSTERKVRDGIALALGALGSAFLGGENVAAVTIFNAIDSEMESQRANLGVAGAAVGMRENALQDAFRITDDARSAELLARESMLESAKYNLRSEAAATGSRQAINRAEKTIAQLDQQIAALRAQQDLRIQQMGYATVGGGYAVPKEVRKLGLKLLEKGVTEEIEVAGAIQLEQAKRMGAAERGGLSAKEFSTELRAYGDRKRDSAVAKSMVDRFMGQYGVGDIPGFKAAWIDPRTRLSELSEEARHVRQSVGMIIDRYRKAITGAQAAERELKIIESRIYGSDTIEDLRHGLRELEGQMGAELEVIDASTLGPIKEAYKRERAAPTVEQPGQVAMETKYTEFKR